MRLNKSLVIISVLLWVFAINIRSAEHIFPFLHSAVSVQFLGHCESDSATHSHDVGHSHDHSEPIEKGGDHSHELPFLTAIKTVDVISSLFTEVEFSFNTLRPVHYEFLLFTTPLFKFTSYMGSYGFMFSQILAYPLISPNAPPTSLIY